MCFEALFSVFPRIYTRFKKFPDAAKISRPLTKTQKESLGYSENDRNCKASEGEVDESQKS